MPEIDATAFFNTQGVDYNKALRVKCENQEFYIWNPEETTETLQNRFEIRQNPMKPQNASKN